MRNVDQIGEEGIVGFELEGSEVFVRVEGWSFGGSMDCIY